MPDKLNKIFKAVSDPTRREIFNMLIIASATLSITQISDRFDITRQGITKHIKMLKEAGLIQMRTQGRENYCSANAEPLKEIRNWVAFYEQFWDDKLGRLGEFLDRNAEKKS